MCTAQAYSFPLGSLSGLRSEFIAFSRNFENLCQGYLKKCYAQFDEEEEDESCSIAFLQYSCAAIQLFAPQLPFSFDVCVVSQSELNFSSAGF